MIYEVEARATAELLIMVEASSRSEAIAIARKELNNEINWHHPGIIDEIRDIRVKKAHERPRETGLLGYPVYE